MINQIKLSCMLIVICIVLIKKKKKKSIEALGETNSLAGHNVQNSHCRVVFVSEFSQL